MTFSAKDLCSRSCMQIKFFNEHPELRPKPNINTEIGTTFQEDVAKSTKGVIGQEMRGTYCNGGLFINFANDIVCQDKIIEVKSVRDKPEDWYFNASVLQCSFYKAMIMSGANRLRTATFFANLGNEEKECTVSSNIDYYLSFGEDKYLIEVKDRNAIVKFFCDKANACLDWTAARQFDFQYKHLEYQTLKEYFSYAKIENINQREGY